MKRIYREVRVAPAGDGWRILLDARTPQTPARAPLLLPWRGLAEAVAAEWDAQAEKVVPATMPLMQLAATAIDRTAVQRGQVIDEIVGYAQTDLVCYRAERPPELAARQSVAWQPLVDWVTLRFDAPLLVTAGVVPKAQPAAAIAAIRAAVEPLDPFRLTALHSATTACGSVVIGLALAERHVDAEAAWQASQLDETFQIEQWGEDAEAAARHAALKRDIEAIDRFLRLLRH
ncbi:MAG: ATP12 family chaperone protein [Dongiaceae bacterium]